MEDRYFEDFKIGERFESRGVTVTESQIVDFALMYDPQSFHIDANAAAESVYGGIISSGWMTLALGFRLWIDTGVLRAASLGSPGLDEVRWLAPVRPGDTLKTFVEIKEIRPSRSKPDRGIVRMKYEIVNQHGDTVCSFIGNQLLARRK